MIPTAAVLHENYVEKDFPHLSICACNMKSEKTSAELPLIVRRPIWPIVVVIAVAAVGVALV